MNKKEKADHKYGRWHLACNLFRNLMLFEHAEYGYLLHNFDVTCIKIFFSYLGCVRVRDQD